METELLQYGHGHPNHNEDYVFCIKCGKGIITNPYLMDNINYCPFCGLKVSTIRSANLHEAMEQLASCVHV